MSDGTRVFCLNTTISCSLHPSSRVDTEEPVCRFCVVKRLEEGVACGLLLENENGLSVYGYSSDVISAEIGKRKVFGCFRLKCKNKLKGNKKEKRRFIFGWRRGARENRGKCEQERDVYEDVRCQMVEVEDISHAQTR